jgi:hypothetical protein
VNVDIARRLGKRPWGKWLARCLLALLLMAAGVFVLVDPRNVMTFQGPGFTRSGGKLGVRIGDTLIEAETKLGKLDGLEFQEVFVGGDCAMRQYPDSEVRFYEEKKGRYGVVCLIMIEGRVREIAWEYSPVGAFP